MAGPFVACALFAHKIEWSGGFLSLINVSNRAFAPRVPVGVRISCNLSFWPGDFRGEQAVTIRCVSPSGKTTTLGAPPLQFTGWELVGMNFTHGLEADAFGLYAFDVYLGDVLMSRMFLEVTPDHGPLPDHGSPDRPRC